MMIRMMKMVMVATSSTKPWSPPSGRWLRPNIIGKPWNANQFQINLKFKNWLRPNIIGRPWKATHFQINLRFNNWLRSNILGKPAKLNLEFELNLCPVHLTLQSNFRLQIHISFWRKWRTDLSPRRRPST